MTHTPSDEPVLTELLPGRIALITLNRPEVLNALGQQSVRLLRAAWRRIENDPDVDVIVLTARGDRAFCVGADLKERQRMSNQDARTFVTSEMLPMFREFDQRSKPAIAAVFGHVMGGGFELTLCCDMIVAAQDAVFALPEVKWGIIPAAAATRKLPSLIGPARAKEMILAGQTLQAADADRLGLVNRVVARDQVLPEALSLAARVVAGVPFAVRAARRCIEDAVAAPAACEFDLRAAQECYESADPARHLAGFGKRS